MFYYQGIPLKNICYGEKLGFIYDFLSFHSSLGFFLPTYRFVQEEEIIPKYTTHHIQYRALTRILPYINIKTTIFSTPSTITILPNPIPTIKPIKMDYSRPQYKYPTVFQVCADIQTDIYHLYVFGKGNQRVYYNVAYIPNYKSSIFMNTLFRKIRENQNLDYIEESEDEEEFENIQEDKFVDLDKMIPMECIFHTKFKRWVPVKVMDKNEKIVHINKLGGI
jgi:hypothetical protein